MYSSNFGISEPSNRPREREEEQYVRARGVEDHGGWSDMNTNIP